MLATTQLAAPVWATCGGGGGGGGGGSGGMSGGGGIPNAAPQVYQVPWKVYKPGPVQGLILYWFPISTNEVANSSLRTSRDLALWSAQGITMMAADVGTPIAQQLNATGKIPLAVLTDPAGTVLGRAEGQKGLLKAPAVEKIVRDELKKRYTAISKNLADAKAKVKAGDKAGAIDLYQSVWSERVLFPKKPRMRPRSSRNSA